MVEEGADGERAAGRDKRDEGLARRDEPREEFVLQPGEADVDAGLVLAGLPALLAAGEEDEVGALGGGSGALDGVEVPVVEDAASLLDLDGRLREERGRSPSHAR